MTSVAEGEAKAASRGRLLWVALILSLTLNVFFIGGLVWSRVIAEHPPAPGQRVQQIARELNLSEDQRDTFHQFILEMRIQIRHLRQSNRPIIEHMWQELGKPKPDEALLAQLIDQSTANRHAYQLQATTVLNHFLSTLSPEQRSQFIGLIHNPHGRPAVRLWKLVLP